MFFFCLLLFWCQHTHHHQTPRSKHHTPRIDHHIPHINIILLASNIVLLASNIILHASTSSATLPPHNIHQARYNATPSNKRHSPLNVHRVDTISTRWMEKRRGFPRRTPAKTVQWCEFGGSSRQNRGGKGATNGSGFTGREGRPVTLTREEACPLSRLAERAEARPEGAWSRKRGGPKGRGPA